jgi:hypothetical protein
LAVNRSTISREIRRDKTTTKKLHWLFAHWLFAHWLFAHSDPEEMDDIIQRTNADNCHIKSWLKMAQTAPVGFLIKTLYKSLDSQGVALLLQLCPAFLLMGFCRKPTTATPIQMKPRPNEA